MMFIVWKGDNSGFGNSVEFYFEWKFTLGMTWRFAYSRSKYIGFLEKQLIWREIPRLTFPFDFPNLISV